MNVFCMQIFVVWKQNLSKKRNTNVFRPEINQGKMSDMTFSFFDWAKAKIQNFKK